MSVPVNILLLCTGINVDKINALYYDLGGYNPCLRVGHCHTSSWNSNLTSDSSDPCEIINSTSWKGIVYDSVWFKDLLFCVEVLKTALA